MHRYKLLERVGTGGYSEVFRTLDQQTGKLCALKVMKQPYEKFRASQDLQLAVLKKFGGRAGIIQLIDSFVEDGLLILVFELLQQTLIEFYRQVRTEHCRGLTAAEIRSILLQLTMAIDVLHTEGYAHRDIKPENVLLERNMESNSLTVKLVDFGLTKKLNNGQNTNYIATRWYRAPELLLSLPYRANVDMFALGCLMAELYSGREVFRGVSSVDQLSEVCNWLGTPTHENWPQGMNKIQAMGVNLPQSKPKSLRILAPGISEDGLDLLGRLLMLNPNRRISAAEMLRHPFFEPAKHQIPAQALKHLLIRPQVESTPTKKSGEHEQAESKTRRKQQSQPKLLSVDPISMFTPGEGSRMNRYSRPVSFNYPISVTRKDNYKPSESNSAHRLNIIVRSKTPSSQKIQPITAEKQADSSISREPVKQQNFMAEADAVESETSFIRRKLKIAEMMNQTHKQPEPANTSTAIAKEKQIQPKLNASLQSPRPLERDTSPNDRTISQRKFHSIDKSARPTLSFRIQESVVQPTVEHRLRQIISTDRLTVKNPPSLQKLAQDVVYSPSKPLRISNSIGKAYIYLKESIPCKTRAKVNSIMLNYRNCK